MKNWWHRKTETSQCPESEATPLQTCNQTWHRCVPGNVRFLISTVIYIYRLRTGFRSTSSFINCKWYYQRSCFFLHYNSMPSLRGWQNQTNEPCWRCSNILATKQIWYSWVNKVNEEWTGGWGRGGCGCICWMPPGSQVGRMLWGLHSLAGPGGPQWARF